MLGVERPALGCSQIVGTAHQQHEATAASSETPDLSSALRLRGKQSRNRSLHVLEDSSEGDSSSRGSPAAAGSWASDSSAGEQDYLPGSSSGPALSSGLRSAVRQLGSSYRLGPGLGTQPESQIRAHAGRHTGAQGSQARDRATREAGGEADVFELSSSEGVYFRLPFDIDFALGSSAYISSEELCPDTHDVSAWLCTHGSVDIGSKTA